MLEEFYRKVYAKAHFELVFVLILTVFAYFLFSQNLNY